MAERVYGLDQAIALTEFGAALREQRLRRDNPGLTDAEVAASMREWWLSRPGAPNGDCPGRVLTWPLDPNRNKHRE